MELKRNGPMQDILNKYRDLAIFYHSTAHIKDLQTDSTKEYLSDLDFISENVDDVQFDFNPVKDKLFINTVSIKEAFYDREPLIKRNIQELVASITSDIPISNSLSNNLLELLQIKIPIGPFDDLDHETKTAIGTILPEGETTMLDLCNRILDTSNEFFTNPNTYLEFRKGFKKLLKSKQLRRPEDFGFYAKNDHQIASLVEVLFRERDTQMATFYHNYVNLYFSLGHINMSFDNVKGETQKKKNQILATNIVTDSLHSYYSTFANYFVTNDKNLLAKSKAMYSYFGISTKVLNLVDFVKEIEEAIYSCNFVDKFIEDIFNYVGQNKKTYLYTSEITGNSFYEIILPKSLLNYFNKITIVVLKGEKEYLIALSRKSTNAFSLWLIKEVARVTDELVKLFREDVDSKGLFQAAEEQQLVEGTWDGRLWENDFCNYGWEINPGTKVPTFTIGPFPIG